MTAALSQHSLHLALKRLQHIQGYKSLDGSREPEALEIPDDDGTRSAFGGCPDDGNGMWGKERRELPRRAFHDDLVFLKSTI